MIIDLPDTTTADVARKLVDRRESAGALALGRVLTLIIVTDDGPAENAIRAASDASREHPAGSSPWSAATGAAARDSTPRSGSAETSASSEALVLRLYGALVEHGDSCVVPFLLPDAPVVAWWPGDPAGTPVGGPHRCDGPASDHRRRRHRPAR